MTRRLLAVLLCIAGGCRVETTSTDGKVLTAEGSLVKVTMRDPAPALPECGRALTFDQKGLLTCRDEHTAFDASGKWVAIQPPDNGRMYYLRVDGLWVARAERVGWTSTPAVGQMWYDKSADPPVWKMYAGWVLVDPKAK